MDVGIIGGGAAGFFAAICVKENYPAANVTIFEQTNNLLAKVKISGGGRCNLTHDCNSISDLLKGYPRGARELKSAFYEFNNHHIIKWFAKRGVATFTEEDGRVFPASQDSQTIVDCFLYQARKLGIRIKCKSKITAIKATDNKSKLSLTLNKHLTRKVELDKVIVTCGGLTKSKKFEWLANLGHEIIPPVPSLFTLNLPNENISSLQGIVALNTRVSLPGTKIAAQGATLITHWGFSGPAILKFSALAARLLNKCNYQCAVQINWIDQRNSDNVLHHLQHTLTKQPKKLLKSYNPFGLPLRLWSYLLQRAHISEERSWNEIGTKCLNILCNLLINDLYQVQGKTTFKEEFVTCGGVSFKSIDKKTMQSKACHNLYFAGEIMNADGITGGYNFQAAWSSAFIAAKLHS